MIVGLPVWFPAAIFGIEFVASVVVWRWSETRSTGVRAVARFLVEVVVAITLVAAFVATFTIAV